MLIALAYVSYWISARDSSSAFVNTPNLSNRLIALSVTIAGIASTMERIFGSPPSLSFLDPRLRVSVSVEDDPLVLDSILLDQVMHCQVEIIRLLQHITRIREGFCYDRVEHDIRGTPRNRGIPPYGTQICFL